MDLEESHTAQAHMADSDDDESSQRVSLRTPAPRSAFERELPPREFVPARCDVSELSDLADLEKLSLLSYNVLSQMGARRLQRNDMGYVDPSLLSTLHRRERLRREILSYDADILCLQEIDDYNDYWATELTAAGYDSVYAMHPSKRASTPRGTPVVLEHGLAIAFKRELFQVFKTQEIDLNEVVATISDENLVAKCHQDCVALCVQLQPWEQSRLPSAVCVVTTQLASGDGQAMDLVRVLQTEFLCRRVSQINAVANLPILLAGTFNALPSSDVYHVISTGRRRPRPQAPKQVDRPEAADATPTSAVLKWKSPPSGDAPIRGYKITIKNCSSATLGFNMHEIEVDGEVDEHTITMLSAGMTYQFRVAARNAIGYGPFSQPSLPLTTPVSTKLQAKCVDNTEAKERERDEEEDDIKMPLYIINDTPPQVKPYEPSYGSGRTPRYETGEKNLNVSPRKLLLRADAKENEFATVRPRGDRDEMLVHGEQFESAYGSYQGFISEPEFTYASEKCIGTVDYIFYSASQFEPFQLLSMPTIEELESLGVDMRQPELTFDQEWAKHKPSGWQDSIGVAKDDDETYSGEWVTPQLPNTFARSNPWLPNKVYPSDHLALACVLAMKTDNLAVQWN